MAFSYSGDPSDSNRDEVRFLIQDTDSSDPLFQDAEIDFLITDEGSPLKAAMRGAETLMAKFSGLCDENVGRVRVAFGQKSEAYMRLCAKFRRRLAIRDAEPFAGALRESQKDSQELDQDRVPPIFTRDKHDFIKHDENLTGRGIQNDSEDP